MRRHTKFGFKIIEIDFVIEIKYLTFLPLSRAQGDWAKNNCAIARPIHVSNSHTCTIFGWISSNGLGGELYNVKLTYIAALVLGHDVDF